MLSSWTTTAARSAFRSTRRSGFALPAGLPHDRAAADARRAAPTAHARVAGAAATAQLGAAREVLRRRVRRLCREPGCLHGPAQERASALRGRGDRIVSRRSDEQLRVEPRLDLPAPARAHRVPGASVLRRVGCCLRREPAAADTVRPGGPRQDRVAGDRGRARHAAQFPRQQALVVSPKALPALAALVAATTVCANAHAATAAADPARLTAARAEQIFLAYPKVRDWLRRYPTRGRSVGATYEPSSQKCTFGTRGGCWNVRVDRSPAGEIASGRVDDLAARVTEAWTGPQVAWKMARGGKGAFGGAKINSYGVWLSFCAVFLLGLADFRRPLSWRNLDLLMLLSFSVSLWFFNHGDVFASVPLAYPPMLYLIARCTWIGFTGRASRSRPVWPYWVLLFAAVFLAGFRIGLNLEDSNVIDVGYAGVIGAERISAGQSPYGHFPIEGSLKACGPADAEGEIRD